MYLEDETDEDWVVDEAADPDPDEDDDDVLACPSCRSEVHEDTQQCPHCGDWIIPVDPRGGSKRWVWVVVAVLLIVSLLLW